MNPMVYPEKIARPLKPGIYAPVPTFFLPESEDLDVPTFQAHVVRLGSIGIYPLIAGSMGEAIHLSSSERVSLVQAARKALDRAGLHYVPLVAGTGTGSTRETIKLCKDAAEAGADYAIVIASGYFLASLSENREALKTFWTDVSWQSPIPVMIYNYPGASGGIDLDSDFIIQLATSCPNICGVKLTCGNVGKLTRITSVVSDPSFVTNYPRKNQDAPFLVLSGYADILLPSILANGHGVITGLANIAPLSIINLFAASKAARLAFDLQVPNFQNVIAQADFVIAKASIAGTKSLLEKLHGYGGAPRRPLLPLKAEEAQALWDHPDVQQLVRMEQLWDEI